MIRHELIRERNEIRSYVKWEKKTQERRPWEEVLEDQVEKRMDFRKGELQVADGRDEMGTSGPWEAEDALRGQC